MKKKFFASMGLAVALALGITAPAFGMNVTSADEFAEAIETNEIRLTANVTGDLVIPAGKTVTLDLNGHTLTAKSSHAITNNGTLTVVGNGVVDAVVHQKAAIYNNAGATATLNGGTYTRSLENGGSNSFYSIKNFGIMTINDGVSVNQGPDQNAQYSSLVANGWQNAANASAPGGEPDVPEGGAKMTINGGAFSGGLNTIKNDDCGTIEIKGGSFSNVAQSALLNWNNASVSGGTFECGATAILNGQCNTAPGFDDGKLVITGGTFTAPTVLDNMGAGYGEDFDSGSIEISGGAFTGVFSDRLIAADTNVTAGTFSDVSAVKYVVGDNAALSKDGTFTVMTEKKAAEAGLVSVEKDGVKVYFTDKEEAVKFAESVTTPGEETPVVTPITVTVTFEDGSDKPVTKTVSKGNTVAKPDDPEREGYVFKGWYADAACTTEFKFDTVIMADTNVYAKWEKIPAVFKVAFNDAFGNTTVVDVTEGAKVAKPEDPTHENYEFVNWYADKDCTTEFDFDKAVTADVEVWAKWKKVEAEKPATEPEKKPESKPGNALPQTGDASMLGVLAAAGAGVVLTGAGFVATRKKK